jgi:15-cis-phytoene desaturase
MIFSLLHPLLLVLISLKLPSTLPLTPDFSTVTSPRPTPPRIFETSNYKAAQALSSKLLSSPPTSKTCIVIGGGLSGLSAALHISPSRQTTLYEARPVLGGKTSAWKTKSGRTVETGLHIFFGAYPNMMGLFATLGIQDRLQWTAHKMSFALPGGAGTTEFSFPPGVPAPLNMAAAILGNGEMLSLADKIKMVPGLLPMLLRGQDFIDECDDLTVGEFMEKYKMPDTVRTEIFVAMSKALDFIDPEKLSMSVILTAMNRFIVESDGSQTAFLDGGQPERLCAPMVERIEAQSGSKVVTGVHVRRINLDPGTGEVASLTLSDGTDVTADVYVSAVPVDVCKKLLPPAWAATPFFKKIAALQGVPVINLQLVSARALTCGGEGERKRGVSLG